MRDRSAVLVSNPAVIGEIIARRGFRIFRDRRPLTVPLAGVTESLRWLAGGKATNLAVLIRAGLPVPGGFCVTAAAFGQFLDASPQLRELSRLLTQRSPDLSGPDLSAKIKVCLANAPIPPLAEQAILAAWHTQGEERAYAVRSSATV